MTIKNPDGTDYKIPKPNPLMRNQVFWKGKAILHNKFGKKVFFSQELKEDKVPQTLPPPNPVVEVQTMDVTDKVSIWCLPAYFDEKFDPLYGDRYVSKRYKEKLLFEGIIDNTNEISIKIRTNAEIPLGSILFPRNYDKRWWEVKKVEKTDLFYIYAEITDFHPYFS